MASFLRSFGFNFILVVLILAIAGKSNALGYTHPIFRPGPWRLAHATFYGDELASETMGTYIYTYAQFNIFQFKIKNSDVTSYIILLK